MFFDIDVSYRLVWADAIYRVFTVKMNFAAADMWVGCVPLDSRRVEHSQKHKNLTLLYVFLTYRRIVSSSLGGRYF